MGIEFNNGQKEVINAAIHWYKESSEQVFQFAGDPGTGKSLVLNEIIKRLGLNINEVAPMAYTGAAAIVMRLKGLINARTIHSWLFEPIMAPIQDGSGNMVMNTYYDRPVVDIQFCPRDLTGIKLIAIDEGRMVDMQLRKEIERRNIKVLVCGDWSQLDPVSGNPGYLREGYDKVIILNEIMRQAQGSGIIYLSQRAKLGLPIHLGLYNNVYVCTEDELNDMLLLQADVILCGRNNTREKYTKIIREKLGYKSDIPQHGEKVICRRNNWQVDVAGINLANGLTGIVSNFPTVTDYDGLSFNLDFVPNLFNAVFQGLHCDYRYFISDYAQRKQILKSRYSNGEKFEFGYALTTHVAQGSQYSKGIYIEEYLNKDINDKINFTALTRFVDYCVYVKPKPKLYYPV